jgi:lipoprotein-anchoring transpeptidase ErfK/SrfK
MVDYVQILARAVASLDPDTRERREAIYDRAHKTLIEKFRGRDPTPLREEFRAEKAALEAAIFQVETELVHRGRRLQSDSAHETEAVSFEAYGDRPPLADGRKRARIAVGALAGMLVLLASGAFYYYSPDVRSVARGILNPPPAAKPAEQLVDNKSYVYMRQFVYYRTNFPVGTLVVDKSQSFLYLVRPRLAALRYTIDVGAECADLVGLYHVVRKEEWPGSRMPSGPSANTPDNQIKSPFGARSLDLTDIYRIHGTSALLPAAQSLSKRCIRLVNDDVIDLYDRAGLGSRVVVLSD